MKRAKNKEFSAPGKNFQQSYPQIPWTAFLLRDVA